MKTTDFNRPVTAKFLSESFTKRYGSKINLERYTIEQLEDFRNKIRTKLSQMESMSRFNETVENSNYQRDKLILDVINQHLEERDASINESLDPKQAGVVQAAIDMQNKIKNMLEDVGSMMTKTMVALADDIKDTIGDAQAEEFGAIVTPALQAAMDHLQGTRTAVEAGVGILTGQSAPETIGAEPEADMSAEMPVEPTTDFANDLEADAGDDFAAADAAAGGADAAGREKRESVQYRKPSITEGNSLMYKLAR
jgi:hypothetical protein